VIKYEAVPRRLLASMVSIAALLIAYASNLRTMAQIWMTDEDLAHGILVPPVIVWIVYRERARLRALPVEPSRWGWLVLGLGAVLQITSVRGAGIFVGSVAFVVSAVGAVLCLGGIAWMRALAFPALLTCFMLPKLTFLYDDVTLPLQLLASRTAAGILSAAGFGVVRAGTILSVSGHQVSVEAACNGIRYLLPLGFVAMLFAYLQKSKLWICAAALIMTVPLAIVANALRVAAAAASPRLATGVWHTGTGIVVFALALPAIPATLGLFRFVDGRLHA
jgi:exosortase